MNNQLLFILHSLVVSTAVIGFGTLGKEALIACISLLFVLANIFVIKQITLFDYNATCADAFIIGVSFGINLLQEIWGKKTSRKTIWISFACCAFYLALSQFHLLYIPASFDTAHHHFAYMFTHTTRIIAASFISYLLVQFADTFMYAFFKKVMNGKYFVIRNYISMFTSQLFDTILFSFLGMYGIVHNIWHIIVISYLLKVVSIIICTPCIWVAKKIVKK